MLKIIEKQMEQPHAIELEQSLLGALLVQNQVIYSIPELQAFHFAEPLHQRIFTAVANGINAGKTVDLFSLKRQFDADPALEDIGGGGYLAKLVSSSIFVRNAPQQANEIIEMAARRKIIAQCTIAMQEAFGFDKQSGEIAASLITGLETENRSKYRISSEREVSARVYEKLKNRTASDCHPTGFPLLDKAMQGGLYAGKLYGIVSRKKMGKTMMVSTISTNLQHIGSKHLYLALEMGSDEIQQRNLAREADCYESAFRNAYGDSEALQRKIADYAANAKNYRLFLDAPGITFDELRQSLPMYIRRYKLSGFILDCWQLVGGKPKGKSTAEHLDEVAQWLAEAVKRYGVWGLVTAQENQDENTRGGEGIRLACDQLYRLCKRDETSPSAWLEMMETRYTPWCQVGEENKPYLRMSEKGTHFEIAP